MQTKKFIDEFFRDITSLGGIYVYGIIALVLFIVGQNKLFFQMLFGAFFSYIIAGAIRLIYFKHRPSKQQFTNIIERIDASSFPSIHAARASFLVIIFSSALNSIIGNIFLFIVGIFICYSRIYLKKHDYADIFGGIIFGILLAYLSFILIA